MRPEARFSKDLIEALETRGCYVIPIETGPTQRGVPDLYIHKGRKHLWIELKVVNQNQKKNPLTAIQIKRQQEMKRSGISVYTFYKIEGGDNGVYYKIPGLTYGDNYPPGSAEVQNNVDDLAYQVVSFLS